MNLSIIEPEGKAKTRSFRLDNAIYREVSKIAEKRNLSVSNLLEKIVTDYVLFYQWSEELGSVIFSPNTIKEIIEAVDEEEIKRIAENVAHATFLKSYLARGDELNQETVRFQIVDQMGRYAHWFQVEEHKEDKHYLYIKHNFGDKWTTFVEAYVKNLYKKIADMDVDTERIGENILVNLE